MTTFDYTFYLIQLKNENNLYKYIGSTKNLYKRIIMHRYTFYKETSKHYNSKIYKTIRENGKWDDVEIIELEHHPMSKDEAHKYEQKLIDEIKPNMNSCKAYSGLSKEEYQNDYNKKYYNENSQKIKDQVKKYKNENLKKLTEKHDCECGGRYSLKSKSDHYKTKKHIKWLEKNKL